MWTDRDFEDLPVLGEYMKLSEFVEICDGYIDEATATALYNYFLLRRVVSGQEVMTADGNTVDYFTLFMQRRLNMYAGQYLQYMRIQTTQIDPLVSQYMERLIERVNVQNRKTTRNTSGNTSGNNRNTSTTTDSRKGNVNVTENGEHNTDRTGKGTETNSATRNTSGTDSGTNSTTRDTNGNTQEQGNAVEKNRAMHAELPQSATGAGDGLPAALNWRYATNQDENQRDNTDTRNTKQTGKETTVGNDSRTTSGNQTDKGNRATDTTENEQGTTKRTGNTDSTESGNSQTVTEGTTGAQHSENGTENAEANDSGNTKERFAGRSESPQALLDMARDYVTRTNAFRWLCDKLDPCFMAWYDI